MNQLVSIVLPVYNAEAYLPECLASLTHQTYVNFEIIAINDGSTDGSEEIIKSLRDSRILYSENDGNRGIVFSLNRGLELARGDFVARMDADDVADETRLHRQVSFLNARPDIAVVGSQGRIIDGDGIDQGAVRWPINKDEIVFAMLLGINPVGHPFVMFRKDAVKAVGGYRDNYYAAEDLDLWFRLFSSGFGISNCEDSLLQYRVHGNQVTQKHRSRQLDSHYRCFHDFISSFSMLTIDAVDIQDYLAAVLFNRDANRTSAELNKVMGLFATLLVIAKRRVEEINDAHIRYLFHEQIIKPHVRRFKLMDVIRLLVSAIRHRLSPGSVLADYLINR